MTDIDVLIVAIEVLLPGRKDAVSVVMVAPKQGSKEITHRRRNEHPRRDIIGGLAAGILDGEHHMQNATDERAIND